MAEGEIYVTLHDALKILNRVQEESLVKKEVRHCSSPTKGDSVFLTVTPGTIVVDTAAG